MATRVMAVVLAGWLWVGWGWVRTAYAVEAPSITDHVFVA